MYILSKAKKEIEEIEWESLKLGVFIDWFYNCFYITSIKSFCFNDDNILEKYISYVECFAEHGNCLNEEDKNRKIRFMVYEQVTYGEEEEEEEEQQSEPYVNNDYFINRNLNFTQETNAAQGNYFVPFYMDAFTTFWRRNEQDFRQGTYNITYSEAGIEKIERIGPAVDYPIPTQYEQLDEQNEQLDEQNEQDIERLNQVLENLHKQQETINSIKTFKSDIRVLCLDEKETVNVLFANCGHLCSCSKCFVKYSKKACRYAKQLMKQLEKYN